MTDPSAPDPTAANPAPSATGPTWATRPLFVSSTFFDLHDERDHLRVHAFLPLEDLLRERRHYLETIDLRQGVDTAGEADEAEREMKVLRVCLDEIRRSRPFFVGLIGDRYGWMPPDERLAAAAQSAGLDFPVAGKSVTELEILYGVLENPDQAARSWFYLRELDYGDMPDDLRKRFDDRLADDPGAPLRAEKLAALKARLLAHPALAGRVRVCRAKWESDPERPRGGHVTGWSVERPAADGSGTIETVSLAQAVQDDLWSDMDPETDSWLLDAPKTWQEADARLLDDFVADRVRGFVEREAVTRPLIDHALSPAAPDAPWGLCLAGPAGSGKSSVFGWVYRDLRERERSGAGPGGQPLWLLAHAAGIHPRSGSVDSLLRRWIHELAARLGRPDPVETAEAEKEASRASAASGDAGMAGIGAMRPGEDAEPLDVEQIFAGLLHQASQKARVVLLLDALNQFERSTRAQYLTWLPKLWPENARFLATAIPGLETETLAAKPGGVVIVRPLDPLSVTEARQVAHRFYERFHREANPRALETLLAKPGPGDKPACGNPLWLELALQEMNLLEADDYARAERDFDKLRPEQRMEALQVREADKLPADPAGLYGELLDRAGRDFGRDFVRATMSLIALGRSGWRESDLAALVPKVKEKLAWDELAFAGLRRTLGHHLVQRGAHGQWEGFHAQLREAVLARELKEEGERKRLHALLADRLEKLPPGDPLRASETMVHLIAFGDAARAALWLGQIQPKRYSSAEICADITGCTRALAAAVETKIDATGSPATVDWISLFFENEEPGTTKAVANIIIFDLSDALHEFGFLEVQRIRLLECSNEALARLTAKDPHDAVAARYLSVSFARLGDYHLIANDRDRAVTNYQKSMEIAQKLFGQNPQDSRAARDLTLSLNKLGDIYTIRNEKDRALECYLQALKVRQQLCERDTNGWGAIDLSSSHYRLGYFFEKRNEEGDSARALENFQKSLDILHGLFKRDPKAQTVARHLASAHLRLGDYLKSYGGPNALLQVLENYQSAVNISRSLFDQNSQIYSVADSLVDSYIRLGNYYLSLKSAEGVALAHENYLKSLEVWQLFCRQNPNNLDALFCLKRSHTQLGHFFQDRGDNDNLARALENYIESDRISQEVYERNPESEDEALDLLISHLNLADFYQRHAESDGGKRALEIFNESDMIAQRIYKLIHPGKIPGDRFFNGLEKLAGYFQERGDFARSFDRYHQAIKIRQMYCQQHPDDERVALALSFSLGSLGSSYESRGQPGDIDRALEHQLQALELRQRLRQRFPNDQSKALLLAGSQGIVAGLYLVQGKSDRALYFYRACVRSLAQFENGNNWDVFQTLDHTRKMIQEIETGLLKSTTSVGGLFSLGDNQELDSSGLELALNSAKKTEFASLSHPVQNRDALTRIEPESILDSLRRVIFPRGGIVMSDYAPLPLRLKFIVALLENGNLDGAETFLRQLFEQDDPGVLALRDAIAAWRKTLNWKHKLGLAPKPPFILPESLRGGFAMGED